MNSVSTSITPVTGAPRRGRGWRIALWLLLALSVLVLAAAFTWVDEIDTTPVEVLLNGTPLMADVDLAAMPAARKVVLALCIAIALLAALVVTVGSVVVALAAVVPIVLLAIALPLLAVGVVLLVLLSPFVLLGWLLWRALRPAPARSTTMPA
jgi:hypothetical protein